jgi:hypothetical protein
MILRDLKQHMLLPKEEIFINKTVKIRGIDVYLISITLEENKSALWTMYKLPCYIDEGIELEGRKEYTSNREEMVNNISQELNCSHIYISEIIIQNQKITFSSSSVSQVSHMNYKEDIAIQHFIEKGMITANWKDADLKTVVIAAYEQKEGEKLPVIDLSKELDITLRVNKEFKQVLINKPISLNFDEMEKGEKLCFYDSIEKKNRIFHINKMYHYDIWKELNHNFDDGKMIALPKEQLKQMKEEYITSIEKICSRGMNLAMIEYEMEEDMQLNFYAKEYLDERPVHNNSSSSAMFFSSGKKLGNNGFKSRVCMIKPIEKDFKGSIDVELFSFFMEMPEEIIRV